MSHSNRREFLRRAASFSVMGAAAPLGLSLAAMGRASAADASGYKALICICLAGGNDGYNTVLATDTDSWSSYTTVRGATEEGNDSLSLRPAGTPAVSRADALMVDKLGGVLPITPKNAQGRSFALHPSLGAAKALFDSGRLGIVSNVAPMVQPTSKAQYLAESVPLPPRLFSHNDQMSQWQAFAVEGRNLGWGGRMADLFSATNGGSMFASIALAGGHPWGVGDVTRSYQMSPLGAIRIGAQDGILNGSTVAQDKLQALLRNPRSGHLIALDHAAVVGRSIDAEVQLRNTMAPAGQAPWGTPGLVTGTLDPLLTVLDPASGLVEANPLAAGLQAVLRMIDSRGRLGVSRQVFFVTLDGFDTHSTQQKRHASLMAKLAHGLKYLDDSLGAMGLRDSVTAFTLSEFGRTFANNGDGCDHGWGGHQLVLGGAVKGRDIHGRFPTYGVSDGGDGYTSDDQLRNGALLPQASTDQYAATLANWFGVSATEQLDLFPNLRNFDASARNLGFV
jgi:uncharacterized protein (DUF1501 family)